MVRRRRRVLCLSFCVCFLLITTIPVLFDSVARFSGMDYSHSYSSLPVFVLSASTTTPPLFELRRKTSGSEPYSALMSARSRKSISESPLESEPKLSHAPRSTESCGFATLDDNPLNRISTKLESVIKMAAKGLRVFHKASSVPNPSVTFPRWYRILRLSELASLSHRPFSAPVFTSPLPPFHIHTCNASTIRFLGFLLMGLTLYGPLKFSSWPNNRSSGPLIIFTWPRSGLTYFLTYSCDLMMRHNALTGRGLCSKLVATWIQVMVDHVPAWPNHFQPSYFIRLRADLYMFPPEDYPHWMLLMARALSFGPSFAWLRSVFFTLLPETTRLMFRYLDQNGRGHRSCLVLISLRLFWNRNIRILIHYLYLITLPNYSFKRRLQISSHWERSFSSSVPKKRTLPPFSTLVTTFPPLYSTMENVVKRSKVLKTLRAICVVRSPLMAEELDFDFKSNISEIFWQKFPVFIYDDYRYSILYLLCSFIYVTSESHSLAKSFPLVT